MVPTIFAKQSEAHAKGALNIWTVYDHPNDFPHSYVARRFEVGPGNDGRPLVTGDILQGELETIRKSFHQCGLCCMPRNETDDIKIIESWL
jgi:hypothetical protein